MKEIKGLPYPPLLRLNVQKERVQIREEARLPSLLTTRKNNNTQSYEQKKM